MASQKHGAPTNPNAEEEWNVEGEEGFFADFGGSGKVSARKRSRMQADNELPENEHGWHSRSEAEISSSREEAKKRIQERVLANARIAASKKKLAVLPAGANAVEKKATKPKGAKPKGKLAKKGKQ